MDKETKNRAIHMLRYLHTKTGNEKLDSYKSYHLPCVYVVGKKIFAFEHAAKSWHYEVDRKSPIENVSIMEAYGVQSRYDLPNDVLVNWKLLNK